MTHTPDINRPPRALCEALAKVGSATAAGELNQMGLRDTFLRGPVPYTRGRSIAGPALTLQFMPKREDVYGANEYDDPEAQLHRHALYHTQEGDIIVVDARGDMTSGIFGSMMLSYFAGKGGKGVIIDGCIRDSTQCLDLDLGYWIKGVTPNYHTQTNIIPFAVNVPIACGEALVYPGDIIIADDDGAVVVPAAMAQELLERATHHVEWEEFTRMKLLEGADLRKYYPLRDDARGEYEAWRAAQASHG
ncbi:ribonuclease activity regulator RraA [Paracoccus sp. NGMCC 1.201697]|uniref:Putative 4-hydroxy-4-methyl-2-oxoglutarate aldolase n=1 Tax=Paracoccus broussonetiae subsp. drimophilus TaxID=3373869 RepID=A0ABW7LGB2_9RHOB